MASREDLDVDDDFRDIYKAYTGPVRTKSDNAPDKTTTSKRSHVGSDEEKDVPDPNAIPTDFTSREAKVWEAKSKATEKNWKKRKEEEMICKICGESGHFTQGCPSTLGGSRKTQEFFERVPAREPHVKALFSEKMVNKIEKDIGCKIKVEEKFIIVSGKDRLILKKGVDAIHKIKEGEQKGFHKPLEEVEHKGSSNSPMSWSRSPERRSPFPSLLGRTDSQKSHPSPHNPQRYGRQDKFVDDRVREDLLKLSNCSPQPQAFGSDGSRARVSSSKSPARPYVMGNSYNSYDGHNKGGLKTDGWQADKGESNMQSNRYVDYPSFPRTLEELELKYKREAVELGRIRDNEEDEENFRHREAVKVISENHMKKVAQLNGEHTKLWGEFLQLQGQRKLQQARHHISVSGFGGYEQQSYPDFDNSVGNPNHSGAGMPMEQRVRYASSMESYPVSRSQDTYGEVQRQRRDDFGKAYNRY